MVDEINVKVKRVSKEIENVNQTNLYIIKTLREIKEKRVKESLQNEIIDSKWISAKYSFSDVYIALYIWTSMKSSYLYTYLWWIDIDKEFVFISIFYLFYIVNNIIFYVLEYS